MLDQILSVLLLGAVVSAIYALVAIGFTMIFGVGGVLNLAHGGLIMVGAYAYVVVTSSSVFGGIALPPVAGFAVAVLITALASYLLYMGLVRYIEDNVVITFLSTVMVALLLTELIHHEFVQGLVVLRPSEDVSKAVKDRHGSGWSAVPQSA